MGQGRDRDVFDAERERRLFARLHDPADPLDSTEVMLRYAPLARRLAQRYRATGEPDEDLLQVAYLGLFNAIRRFDVDRGSPFTSFARAVIRGEILHHLRDTTWLVRLSRRQQHLALDVERCVWELTAEIGRHPTPAELARATGTSVAEVDDARLALRAHHPESLHGPAGDPSDGELAIIDTLAQEDQELVAVLDRDDLRVALRMLPCAHREVVSLYYEHGLTQQEAARRVGLSQRQVSRLLGQARDRLEAICLAETG